YAQQIPQTVATYIDPEVRNHLSTEQSNEPIGLTAVMHTHNTLPTMAQKYKVPMWKVPASNLEAEDKSTVAGNRGAFEATREQYQRFAEVFLERVNTLE